jgi:hypothetical protein
MAGDEIPIELHPLVQEVAEEPPREAAPPPEMDEHGSTQAAPLKGPLRQALWPNVIVIVTFVFLTVAIILAWKTGDSGVVYSADPLEDATARLRVVRILAEINTLLLTALVAMSGKIAAWAASSSRAGVSIPLWLAMTPTTGTMGLLRLLCWGKKSNGKSRKWHHRAWIVVRYAKLFLPNIS